MDFFCPICYQNTNNNIILNCKHKFCKKCISKWVKIRHNCPICRNIINDNIYIFEALLSIILFIILIPIIMTFIFILSCSFLIYIFLN